MENIKITYQVMGDNRSHKTSYMSIYKEKYIQVHIDYLIE